MIIKITTNCHGLLKFDDIRKVLLHSEEFCKISIGEAHSVDRKRIYFESIKLETLMLDDHSMMHSSSLDYNLK